MGWDGTGWDQRHPDVFRAFRICKLHWFVRRLKMTLIQLRSSKGVNGMTGFSKCYTKCMQVSQRMAVTDTGYVFSLSPDLFSVFLTLSSRVVPSLLRRFRAERWCSDVCFSR
jgi:hypothetical protein